MSSRHPPHFPLLHVRVLGAPQGQDRRLGSGVGGLGLAGAAQLRHQYFCWEQLSAILH